MNTSEKADGIFKIKVPFFSMEAPVKSMSVGSVILIMLIAVIIVLGLIFMLHYVVPLYEMQKPLRGMLGKMFRIRSP